ncbi:MAG: molecular chaperone GrpE [Candidatus Thermoplasmatota archaeon]|nr:molecular chaperone GrpE [Candidatus Thermoplasmatota archaeon]
MAEEDAGELDTSEDGHDAERTPPPDPVAERDRRIEELTDDLKRLQAEFENYKKRVAKEGAEMSKAGAEVVVRDLLAVMDTLDKALEDAGTNDYPKQLKKGLEGIHRQLLQTLQRQGLREIGTDGVFDPFEHEAMNREEREDMEDGSILEVFQKGYALGPKVIRTAKVKVSKTPEAEEVHDAQESQSEKRGE